MMNNNESKKIGINGQCVFIYNIIFGENHNPSFVIYDNFKTNGIKIELTSKNIQVHLLNPYTPLIDVSNQVGYQYEIPQYWFSLDSQNRRLYGGIGEPRLETATYKYIFQDVSYKKILESFVRIEYNSQIYPKKVLKDPIRRCIPLLVKDIDELTMEDIANDKYIPKANLSLMGKKLYECIAGKKFKLNTPDFPDFSRAIEYSIKTPGCWCNTILKNKASEFNKEKPNIKETYLRITLGENNGESPGIPYVMEIWPIGHYSPIHSHADSEAIIRVLNGSIHIKMYPYLSEKMPSSFKNVDLIEGDITWISPLFNQIHQLENLSTNKDTCITIQCYMYNEKNKKHYDYFDYIDVNNEIQPYEPDSDMDFIDFKECMRTEWSKNTNLSNILYNFI